MRSVRYLPCLLFCLLATAEAVAQTADAGPVSAMAAPRDCGAPEDVTRFKAKLPNTARAIRGGRPLTIVAIGSSSTQGVGATDAKLSYPAQLAVALRQRWPNLDVRVINKGVGGEDALGMLGRFETDVLAYNPQLVIWQVGSNYALRNRDPDAYAAILRKGVNRLKSARTDIVLMDLQYAPRVLDKPAHRRVLDTMDRLADTLKVAIFHRFEVMRYWVSSGRYRMDEVVTHDRLHMNDTGYRCIGRLLAESVSVAARAVLPSPAEGAAVARSLAPPAGRDALAR